MQASAPIPPGRGDQKRRAAGAGAEALAAWGAAHAKELEVVAQRRDADGPMIDRALEVVRKFIVERRLILFGGLAIDYALRLRGSKLYPDDERPDFDLLSPRSVDDAYDLADILRAAGFEGVGAVRGIHVQTMRVKTDFVWVADIGYAPQDVYDSVPTLEFRGIRLVHPDFQRMDMHLAFCFPFNNPPREDVFHRWKKDLKRLNMFEQFYPIAGGGEESGGGARQHVSAHAASAILADAPRDPAVALQGFAAYAILREALEELAAAPAFAGLAESTGVRAALKAIPRLDLRFPDAHSLSLEVPAGAAALAHLACPEPDALVAKEHAVQWFDPYMDLCPEVARLDGLAVLSTRGRLLAVSSVSVPVAGAAKKRALVVTPQYLLLHFLLEAHRAADARERTVYRSYYRHTLAILGAAEGIYAARIEELSKGVEELSKGAEELSEGAAARDVLDSYAASPFAPTVQTLGAVNTSAAYIIKMATSAERLRDTPPPVLGLDPHLADLLVGLPTNYYPDKAKSRPAFDYGASSLFRRSGARRAGPGA